jgi:serine/threonine protein kinase
MSTLETNRLFERYRIIQRLGSGVSGESYEAEDTVLLRKVTLKLIHPKSTLPDAARRQFFREMQGISILNHPYLASVLDYGEIDGTLYVARRYVSNGSFLGNSGRLWFPTPMDVSIAIQYAHQLAQVLQYIHSRRYLHGSLTFSNILVFRGPNLENETDYAPFLLADVGLTNFVRRFGEQVSTPLPITAAPEQLGKRVIPASDQFALAVVLYFWLTGQLPYVGSPEEIEHLKLTETITPLSSLCPEVTVEQDGMLLRALSVYPEDRYSSILAFTSALLATLPSKSQLALESEPTDQAASRAQAFSEPVPQPPPHIEPDVPQPLPVPGVPQPQPSPEPEPGVPQPMPNPEPETPTQNELPPVEQLPGTQEQPSEMLVEPAVVAARLIIISPYSQEPYEIELQSDEMTIGRAGSSDILLDRDDLTSRHHALLKLENDCYVLYDRRSANGVQVNGQQLKGDNGFELLDGDHVSIGNYELIFHLSPPNTTGGEERNLAAHNPTATSIGA